MSKTLKTRVDELERRSGGTTVIGVTYDGELVHITGTDTDITVDEFVRLYPDNGVILRVRYEDVLIP